MSLLGHAVVEQLLVLRAPLLLMVLQHLVHLPAPRVTKGASIRSVAEFSTRSYPSLFTCAAHYGAVHSAYRPTHT